MDICVYAYDPNEGDEVVEIAADEVRDWLARDQALLWVSLTEASEANTKLLSEEFKFHELLIEDAMNSATTPKMEVVENCVYLILHGLEPAAAPKNPKAKSKSHVALVDVDFFVGDHFLVTHHRNSSMPSLASVRREVLGENSPLKKGPAYVAHRLIDVMVDRFAPLMESLVEVVVDIEGRVLDDPDPSLISKIFSIKHDLQRLRRVSLHQQRIIRSIARDDIRFIPYKVRPFFRDIEDHFVQVVDLIESYRELAQSSLEAYLSMQSHRLNEVMKILTIISTIMLPLTFLTGLYGMNFDEMPLIHWKYGFEGSIALMLVSALLSFWWMKKKGWLNA